MSVLSHYVTYVHFVTLGLFPLLLYVVTDASDRRPTRYPNALRAFIGTNVCGGLVFMVCIMPLVTLGFDGPYRAVLDFVAQSSAAMGMVSGLLGLLWGIAVFASLYSSVIVGLLLLVALGESFTRKNPPATSAALASLSPKTCTLLD